MLYNSAYNLDQLSKYYGSIKNSDTLALLTNVNPMVVHGNDTYSCDDNGIFHFNLYTSALYFYLGNDIELNEGDYIEIECDVLNIGPSPVKFWLSPRSIDADYSKFIIESPTTKLNEWEHIKIRLLCPGKTIYRTSFGYNTNESGEFYIKNLVRKIKTYNSKHYDNPDLSNYIIDGQDIKTNKIESGSDAPCVVYGHKRVELWSDTYASVLDETNGAFRPSGASSNLGLNLGTNDNRWNNVFCKVSPNVSSNREIKKDIELYDCNKAYEGIQNLNIYSYRMKDEKAFGDELYYGCMLDEMPEECMHIKDNGVDLYGYISYATSALKVAINKIKELEKEIEKLKGN